MMAKRKAFTLIELFVIVAIVGLLGVIAVACYYKSQISPVQATTTTSRPATIVQFVNRQVDVAEISVGDFVVWNDDSVSVVVAIANNGHTVNLQRYGCDPIVIATELVALKANGVLHYQHELGSIYAMAAHRYFTGE